MNWRRFGWALVGCICAPRVAVVVADSAPAPIAVQPSQYWEGRDGTWSSFTLKLGTPPQEIRVDPSTVWPYTQAISVDQCLDPTYTACAQDHGQLFKPNASTTWQEHALFPLYPELNLTHQNDSGLFGVDIIQLGENGPTVNNQEIASITISHYWQGLLGLNPSPATWRQFDGIQTPNILQTLVTNKQIPSTSYGFHAGAQYRFSRVPGSLTLGGFDASRATTTNFSFPIDTDAQRPLGVAMQSINFQGSDKDSQELLPEPKIAYLDSTIAWNVFPSDVCAAFEKAFGIQWNESAAGGTGMYLLSDDQHNKLVQENPNVTFTLGTELQGGNTVNITLPYAAFDLNARFPYVKFSTPYFPLRPAGNDSQITLGRVFFQEAMIIADFDRKNFSVSPVQWTENAKSNIIPIYPNGYAGSTNSNSPSASTSSLPSGPPNTLPVALGVGLGVGLPIVTLIAFLIFARGRRSWPFDRSKGDFGGDSTGGLGGMSKGRSSTEKDSSLVHEAVPTQNVFFYEAASTNKPHPELPGAPGKRQFSADDSELPASPAPFNSGKPRELSDSAYPPEVPGMTGPGELPSEPVPPAYLSQRSSAATSRTPSLTSAASPRESAQQPPLPPLPPYKESVSLSPTSPQSATRSSSTSGQSTTRSELERSFRATRDARARGRITSEGHRTVNDGGWI